MSLSSDNKEKSWVKIAIALIGIIGTIGTSLVASEFFWKQVGNQVSGDASKSAPISAKAPDSNAHQNALKDFSKYANEFDRLTKEERIKADQAIRQVAKSLTLGDLQEYARESRRWGYRASAGTALAGLLAASPTLVENQYDRLIEMIEYGLHDSISFVRYRYVAVLEENPKLAQHFRRELLEIVAKDDNEAVQEKARRTLKHQS